MIQKQHHLDVYKHASMLYTTAMEDTSWLLSTCMMFIRQYSAPLLNMDNNKTQSNNNSNKTTTTNDYCANTACLCTTCTCNPCKCANTPNNSLNTTMHSLTSNGSNNSINDIPTLKVQFLSKVDPINRSILCRYTNVNLF